MIEADFFDILDQVGRWVRCRTAGCVSFGECVCPVSTVPFGGIQVIFCGDFLQLPPVVQADMLAMKNGRILCFRSRVWSQLHLHIALLQQVHRQNDPEFVQVRENTMVTETRERMRGRRASFL